MHFKVSLLMQYSIWTKQELFMKILQLGQLALSENLKFQSRLRKAKENISLSLLLDECLWKYPSANDRSNHNEIHYLYSQHFLLEWNSFFNFFLTNSTIFSLFRQSNQVLSVWKRIQLRSILNIQVPASLVSDFEEVEGFLWWGWESFFSRSFQILPQRDGLQGESPLRCKFLSGWLGKLFQQSESVGDTKVQKVTWGQNIG